MTSEAQKQAMIAASFQKHFYQYGFKKTSVDDIARDLSMSKKTIYQLFPSKEAIYAYLENSVAVQYRQRLDQRLASLPSSDARAADATRIYLEEMRRWSAPPEDFEKTYRYMLARGAFERAFLGVLEDVAAAAETDRDRAARRARLALGTARTGLAETADAQDPNAIEDVVGAVQRVLR